MQVMPCGTDLHSQPCCPACTNKVRSNLARCIHPPLTGIYLTQQRRGWSITPQSCSSYLGASMQAPFPVCDRLVQLLQASSSSAGDASSMAAGSAAAAAGAQALLPIAGCSDCWRHCTRCGGQGSAVCFVSLYVICASQEGAVCPEPSLTSSAAAGTCG